MSTSLLIKDLEASKEKDRKALRKVFGSGRITCEFAGSSIGGMSAWQYTGVNFRSFVGNSYLKGHGWTHKFRTGYQYRREQFQWNYFSEFDK